MVMDKSLNILYMLQDRLVEFFYLFVSHKKKALIAVSSEQ